MIIQRRITDKTVKPASAKRLKFGVKKYAALHLLLARWLRLSATPASKYVYVTLGGTELRDLTSLRFIDSALVDKVISYEADAERFKRAMSTRTRLSSAGVDVQVVNADIFDFRRDPADVRSHIFFVDLMGICAWSEYDRQFGRLFLDSDIREGDFLMVTTHMGRNRGWNEVAKHFQGQFAMLQANSQEEQRVLFRSAHPSMTLHRGLENARIVSEVELRCIGAVSYRDSTPMALFGYTIRSGQTKLKAFVRDAATAFFDLNKHSQVRASEF